LEVRYPFFRSNISQLKMSQISDLLSSYKELCLHILVHSMNIDVVADQIKLIKPLKLKVKEQNEAYFKLIQLKKLSIKSLQKSIIKRMNKVGKIELRVKKLVLLPDCLIEVDEDVELLKDGDCLEVEFGSLDLNRSFDIDGSTN